MVILRIVGIMRASGLTGKPGGTCKTFWKRWAQELPVTAVRFRAAPLPDRHRHNTSHKHAGSPVGYYFGGVDIYVRTRATALDGRARLLQVVLVATNLFSFDPEHEGARMDVIEVATDCCDQCGPSTRAYLYARLKSGRTLSYCGSCGTRHEHALRAQGATIIDMRHQIGSS